MPTPKQLSHYPKDWDEAHATSSEIRSFATRFRIARAYEGLRIKDGIGEPTVRGYESLIRLLLTYSAYERFERKFGLASNEKRKEIENKHSLEARITRIFSNHSDCQPLFSFLEKKSDSKSLQANARSLFREQSGSLVLFAESIRHVFVHGQFAPSTWQQDPSVAASIFDITSDFLMEIMDLEAAPRMKKMQKKK